MKTQETEAPQGQVQALDRKQNTNFIAPDESEEHGAAERSNTDTVTADTDKEAESNIDSTTPTAVSGGSTKNMLKVFKKSGQAVRLQVQALGTVAAVRDAAREHAAIVADKAQQQITKAKRDVLAHAAPMPCYGVSAAAMRRVVDCWQEPPSIIDVGENQDSIRKNGFLEKEAEMGLPFCGKGWKTRWAVLHSDGVLYYFESFKQLSGNIAKGAICVDGAELTKLDSFHDQDFCLRIVSPMARRPHKAAPSVWLLGFSSELDAKAWLDAFVSVPNAKVTVTEEGPCQQSGALNAVESSQD